MHPTASDEARAAFDRLGADLAGAGVVPGTMFGMPCLKSGRNTFAGLFGEAAVFKLPAATLAEALALPGAKLFDPAGGRPMREWAVVPLASAERWPDLADTALAYVNQV
jgi:hypothetical protein